MSELQNNNSGELVNRAVAAMRQLPLPTGPSPAAVSRTLAALQKAERPTEVSVLHRFPHVPWRLKWSVPLATAASLFVLCVGLFNLTGSGPAFAEVVKALQNVRTATWKIQSEFKGPKDEAYTSTGVGMFLSPSHERTEMTVRGITTVQIVDGQQDHFITLIPAAKSAIVFDIKNLPPGGENPFGKTFLGLQSLAAATEESKVAKLERLGSTTIDGRQSVGFRVDMGAKEMKIWADSQTLLPIRVEVSTGEESHTVMTDFQFDVELDPALFRLDVPDGYTVQQTNQIDFSQEPSAPSH